MLLANATGWSLAEISDLDIEDLRDWCETVREVRELLSAR